MRDEAIGWVLLARLIEDILNVTFREFLVDEQHGLHIFFAGDSLSVSWGWITESKDVIIKNAILKTREQILMTMRKFPGIIIKLTHLPSEKISADLMSKLIPNQYKQSVIEGRSKISSETHGSS